MTLSKATESKLTLKATDMKDNLKITSKMVSESKNLLTVIDSLANGLTVSKMEKEHYIQQSKRKPIKATFKMDSAQVKENFYLNLEIFSKDIGKIIKNKVKDLSFSLMAMSSKVTGRMM